MQTEKRNLKDIHPYENNPRKNDNAVDAVAESIKQCGYIAPIIVDEDGVIIVGHTRLKAMKKLGWTEAEVLVRSDLTEDQKKKYRLLDNKTGELATWDLGLLDDELIGMDFDGFDFGFDMGEEACPDDDDYDFVDPEDAKTKTGQLFKIGDHRLLCGDATDQECVEKLMGGRSRTCF